MYVNVGRSPGQCVGATSENGASNMSDQAPYWTD